MHHADTRQRLNCRHGGILDLYLPFKRPVKSLTLLLFRLFCQRKTKQVNEVLFASLDTEVFTLKLSEGTRAERSTDTKALRRQLKVSSNRLLKWRNESATKLLH